MPCNHEAVYKLGVIGVHTCPSCKQEIKITWEDLRRQDSLKGFD